MIVLLFISAKCSQSRIQGVSKNATIEKLNQDLNAVLDDGTEQAIALQEEILFRRTDPLKDKNTVEIIDSTIVIGDTIYWRIDKRTVRRNLYLEEYPTDTLIKLLQKKVIYSSGGGDNRRDWFELAEGTRENATALQTACLIKKNKLIRRPDGSFELRTRPFSEANRLCTAERFFGQPVAGFCSGFGVNDRLFVTAGHCLESDSDINSFYVVYNFNQEDMNKARVVFTPDEVYTAVELVRRRHVDGEDFAVIRLDKTIPANRQATIRTSAVRNGEPVFVIGHPCGLPLKYADGATVRDTSSPNFFLADLDTYGGNSGSPVYDESHQVVGILVRGATDFLFNYSSKCYYSNVCTSFGTSNCSGEGISRVSQFHEFIVN